MNITREQRARQFAPFDALQGLGEVMSTAEKFIEPRADLAEEVLEELDKEFMRIEVGDIVNVTYYNISEYRYIETVGVVSRIDEGDRVICVGGRDIRLTDIKKLRVTGIF